ncbi:MAG: DNA-protecting protein DprA, partial [Bacteroidia bacterium]|nr:DNA-protecting protein DprA [Bacteroidia bacterium]
VGPVLGKTLVSYCGSLEAVFREKKTRLEKIPGIGSIIAASVSTSDVMERAEEESVFIRKHKVTPIFFTEADYPHRLKHCEDSPLMLYYKGKGNLNHTRILAIVGTRKATDYGKKVCEEIVRQLAPLDVCISSGLAYGIDICAHKAALKNNLSTIAVLAHGLDMIYPGTHRATAEKMLDNGGLLTEFMTKTKPDKENFPSRNRIVAGMSDAVLVIESAVKGGAIITANIANSYNRDVFALPGRNDDEYSLGCNYLIKKNKAALVESAEDIAYQLGWENNENEKTKKPSQLSIFNELKDDEKELVHLLQQNGKLAIDSICLRAKLPMGKVATTLLNLEFRGIVRSLPGKIYQIA